MTSHNFWQPLRSVVSKMDVLDSSTESQKLLPKFASFLSSPSILYLHLVSTFVSIAVLSLCKCKWGIFTLDESLEQILLTFFSINQNTNYAGNNCTGKIFWF
jgi:hypothetical protein